MHKHTSMQCGEKCTKFEIPWKPATEKEPVSVHTMAKFFDTLINYATRRVVDLGVWLE